MSTDSADSEAVELEALCARYRELWEMAETAQAEAKALRGPVNQLAERVVLRTRMEKGDAAARDLCRRIIESTPTRKILGMVMGPHLKSLANALGIAPQALTLTLGLRDEKIGDPIPCYVCKEPSGKIVAPFVPASSLQLCESCDAEQRRKWKEEDRRLGAKRNGPSVLGAPDGYILQQDGIQVCYEWCEGWGGDHQWCGWMATAWLGENKALRGIGADQFSAYQQLVQSLLEGSDLFIARGEGA